MPVIGPLVLFHAAFALGAAPPRHHEPTLGVSIELPAGAATRVAERTLTITAPGRPPVVITVSDTSSGRGSGIRGGHVWRKVDEVRYTIFVPKRQATCVADALDQRGSQFAVAVCESVQLTPAPRRPNVVITVSGDGAVDLAAAERAVQAHADEVQACWLAALEANPQHAEGIIELVHHSRPSDDGEPPRTGVDLGAQLFFSTDARRLMKCVASHLEPVPVRLRPQARVTVSVDCLLR